jgi:ribosomal protein L35AE/L33A
LEEISGDGGNFMGIIWKYGDSLVRIFNGKVRKLHGDDGIIAGLHE